MKSITLTMSKIALTLTLVTTITSNGTAMINDFAAKTPSEQFASIQEFDAKEFSKDLFGYDDNKVVATVFDAMDTFSDVEYDDIDEAVVGTLTSTLSSAISSANE